MECRIAIMRHVFGKSIRYNLRCNQRPALLMLEGFLRPKSDMVQNSTQGEMMPVHKIVKDVEIPGPLKHLLKGQENVTKITRFSFFRGKVEQKIDKYHILAFEKALIEERHKEGFMRVIHDFMAKDRLKRGHLSFVYTSLNYVGAFGLEKDIDIYNEILEVLPKHKIVNRTLLDALWPKPYPQIDAALDLLTEMEDNGIRPDDLTYTILLEVFGRASLPLQKVQRMAYWFDKYQHANPHLLSEEELKDRFNVCKLALKRMTMDEESIKIYACEDAFDNEYEKSFIIGSQNEEQKKFLAGHDTSKTLYVEGPFGIWMNHIKEQYYLLRSESLTIENPLTHEDDTRVREGMVLGICITNRSVKEALQSWLSHLQKENPRLSEFKIIFNVNVQDEIVPNSCKI